MKTKNIPTGLMIIGLAFAVIFSLPASAQYTPTTLYASHTLSCSSVHPGDECVIYITLTNYGLTADNVVLSLKGTEDIRVSKQWQVGQVLAGTTLTYSAKFTVEEDAREGLHTLNLKAFYDGYKSNGGSDDYKEENWEIPITVSSTPNFIVESSTTDTENLKPGDRVKLQINIKNEGVGTAYDTNAELDLASVSGISVIGSQRVYLSDVNSGDESKIEFTLYLDESIATGAYSLPLTLTYEDKNHAAGTATLYTGIEVQGDVQLSLSISETDPDEVHKDDEDIEIIVKVDNLGTKDLKNVKVTFNPQYPFENAKSYIQTKDLGTLKASTDTEISFYANVDENAVPNITEQLFDVEYKVENIKNQKIYGLQIEVKDYPDFQINNASIETSPGKYAELRMTVKNTGSECDSVTVWALKKSDHPFEFDDKSEFIGDLDTGDSGEAVFGFTVDSDAKKKEYILPLEVRCTKNNDVLTFSRTARITVDGKEDSGNLSYLAGAALLGIIGVGAYTYKRKNTINQ